MLSRKIWLMLMTLILALLAASYAYMNSSVRKISERLETESNQRLIDKADGNLDALETAFASGAVDKSRLILKQLSQGERVVCVTLLMDTKQVSYPETCDLKNSEATIAVSTKSGTTLKIDTRESFAQELEPALRNSFALLLLGFIVTLVFFISAFSYSFRHTAWYFLQMLEALSDSKSQPTPSTFLFNYKSFQPLVDGVSTRLEDYSKVQVKRAQEAAVVKVAAQVSHDIRSPLAVLNMLSARLPFENEEARHLYSSSVERIRSISNSLLDHPENFKSWVKQSAPAFNPSSELRSLVDLQASLARIVSEKSVLSPAIPIIVECQEQIWLRVQPTEWNRILSNLLNNAVEAMADRTGEIKVQVSKTQGPDQQDGWVVLTLRDQGKGISPEMLAKIGDFAESEGKMSGTGLGIYHALQTLKNWGGDLLIESVENVGTIITILLPVEEKEVNSSPQLSFTGNQIVRIGMSSPEDGLEQKALLTFSTLNEFIYYYGKNFTEFDHALFIFEIGLDLPEVMLAIRSLGIEEQSIVQIKKGESIGIFTEFEAMRVRVNQLIKYGPRN